MPLVKPKVAAAAGIIPVPNTASARRGRPAKNTLPPTPAERQRMRQFAQRYVAEYQPVPPLPLAILREHAERLLRLLGAEPQYRQYAGVVINNEMWCETFASVPYHKRLLLLPKCLRESAECPAPIDEFGLLCRRCGRCSLRELQEEAEGLGYAVLVAEGSAVVTALLQSGKIEAILGVSCLNALERAFPYMEAASIPGLAIPLLQDDCVDTAVDLDWVWEYLHLTGEDRTRRLDLGALRQEVESWFSPAALEALLGPAQGETERIAREWLARAGKRWRPFLSAAIFQALVQPAGAPLPPEVRLVAVAVECFHKASLIHDDIEDNDSTRYGERTLHAEYGLAIALNIGDLLIGEGYRLLGACSLGAEQKVQMLTVAAEGQRQLCQGQGAELCWVRAPQPLTPPQVLEIFRQKTAPAFEVALKLGALCAEGLAAKQAGNVCNTVGSSRFETIVPALEAYSRALGIAYQIRDDLSDFGIRAEGSDLVQLRPGLLLALALQKAAGASLPLLQSFCQRSAPPGTAVTQIESLLLELGVEQEARTLLQAYQEEAIRALSALANPDLKGLLRRIVGRIFKDPEVKAWCQGFPPDPA